MTCAHRKVEAWLLCADGKEYHGTNDCNRPQLVCPRKPEEGYLKCSTICGQPHHAEIAALKKAREAGSDTKGSEIVIRGHYRICTQCAIQLRDAGVRLIMIEVTQ